MSTREGYTTIYASHRSSDGIMLPYRLDGRRPSYASDTSSHQRATVMVPALVDDAEGSLPRYVEARLNLSLADLDVLIGQLNGLRKWLNEPFRDYKADADFLVERGVFTKAPNGYGVDVYTWTDGRAGGAGGAEGVVNAYEKETEITMLEAREAAAAIDEQMEALR